ncbi:MAG: thiamine phosphate synthase [Firmicutes bacterium]|nr:thiamine phosphate synthase [Bacillota bacterium]
MKSVSKNCKAESLKVYAVTDRHWTGEQTLMEQVELALQGGATFVQLREKHLSDEEFLAEAIEMKVLCAKYNVPFVINDNVQVAIDCDADGVHVGQSDMEAGNVRTALGPDKIIGVSAQTVEQALLAQERGADYLGVGAVFPTGSKDDADEVGHDVLKEICEAVEIPVVAIGGITRDNVIELAGTGIDGISVISAIFGKPDIKAATEDLVAQTETMLKA